MEDRNLSESEDNMMYNIETTNRYTEGQNGANSGFEIVNKTKKRKFKSGSSGSISSNSFAKMTEDNKLTSIFEQLNKNYQKISEIENQQGKYIKEIQCINKSYL